jgi:Spy/CpxP family protein refolding chaperone
LEWEQAANAVKIPDEEVLEARAAESDKGFEAPFHQHLTAEGQAEVYKYVLEKRRKQAQQDERSSLPNEAGENADVKDSVSAEKAGTSDDTGSDRVSFVSAVESASSSRKDKKKRRTQRHLEAKGDGFVVSTPEQHPMRLQNAVILKAPPKSLG